MTPNLDRIAQKGILFNKAYTPSSKCAPSRSVVITGRNPWQLEEAANHQPDFPKKFKSVVEALGENGYVTGYTGKGWGPGETGGRDLTGPAFNKYKTKPPTKKISSIDYTANFKAFLDSRDKSKPFFFWYGSKEPHRDYEYKSGARLGKKLKDVDFLPSFFGNDESVKHDILDYAIEVEYSDMHLGNILALLEKAGELDNTLVITTSDNSMPFPRFKGGPHEHATHLPLAVMWPGKIKNPGRVSEEFMSFIDFAPTFLEVAGISHKQSKMAEIEGKSLMDIFANKPVGRDVLLTGRERNDIGRPHDRGYPVRSLHKGKFVYMHNFEPDRWPNGNPETDYLDVDSSPTKSSVLAAGESSFEYQMIMAKRPAEELYDLEKDPECVNNLSDNPEYKNLKEKMKKELFVELTRQGDPRMHGKGDVFDAYEHIYRAGYYEILMATGKPPINKAKLKNKKKQ